MSEVFFDVSIITVAATILALVARYLKQPIILAFVITGFLLSSQITGLMVNQAFIAELSTFGIALLLFLVGIELDLNKLSSLGKTALWLGFLQVILTTVAAFLLAVILGFSSIVSLYIGVALAFSSTIIVVKIMSEQKALDSLYGRISLGTLLIQDLLAIVALIVLSGINSTGASSNWLLILLATLKGIIFVSVILLAQKYILHKLFAWLTSSSEMLLLSSLAWCFAVALVANLAGFSLEIGAFLAGIALAPLPYNLEIISRVKPLRDFFITLFFVALGTQLIVTGDMTWLWPVLILILFVLLLKPLIVMLILGALGYKKRTNFLVGISLAQISEFSLVLMTVGLRLGHLSPALISVITMVTVVSIVVSSYYITYGEKIYRQLAPYLGWLEKGDDGMEISLDPPTNLKQHAVVFGYHRLGEKIVNTLLKLDQKVLVIDFNPVAIKHLTNENLISIYGDMSDLEILEKAKIDKARMVISTVPDLDDNLLLLKDLKTKSSKVPVYVTANSWHETKALYEAGADYVIFPHHLSGEHFSLMLQSLMIDQNRILADKAHHLDELNAHYTSFHHK